jgi:hypothetical protein
VPPSDDGTSRPCCRTGWPRPVRHQALSALNSPACSTQFLGPAARVSLPAVEDPGAPDAVAKPRAWHVGQPTCLFGPATRPPLDFLRRTRTRRRRRSSRTGRRSRASRTRARRAVPGVPPSGGTSRAVSWCPRDHPPATWAAGYSKSHIERRVVLLRCDHDRRPGASARGAHEVPRAAGPSAVTGAVAVQPIRDQGETMYSFADQPRCAGARRFRAARPEAGVRQQLAARQNQLTLFDGTAPR